jgi:hypothetical protein
MEVNRQIFTFGKGSAGQRDVAFQGINVELSLIDHNKLIPRKSSAPVKRQKALRATEASLAKPLKNVGNDLYSFPSHLIYLISPASPSQHLSMVVAPESWNSEPRMRITA